MNPTAVLVSRFLKACLLGVGLGFLYDLFASLPRRFRHIGDTLFIIGLFVCGIYLGFGVCQGDLRPVYSAGLLIGASGWHYTIGKLFRMLLIRFFHLLIKLFFIIFRPIKKIFIFISVFFQKNICIN